MNNKENIEEYDDTDDEDTPTKNARKTIVYKHSDDLYISIEPRCYVLTNKKKTDTFYTNLSTAFKALSYTLLHEEFGKIPNSEKMDIKNVIRIIEEHDKRMVEMFKGY